jgi:hypothetical protein
MGKDPGAAGTKTLGVAGVIRVVVGNQDGVDVRRTMTELGERGDELGPVPR